MPTSYTEVKLSPFNVYIVNRGQAKSVQCPHCTQRSRSSKVCSMPTLYTEVKQSLFDVYIIHRGPAKSVQCLHHTQRNVYIIHRGQAKSVRCLHHTQRSSKVCSMPTSYTEVKQSPVSYTHLTLPTNAEV